MKNTAAHRFLRRLHQNGVAYIFANAGTDFPPLIEAYAAADGVDMPEIWAIPHENVAVAIASGYAVATGHPQVVMVHVNVGLANTICGVMNASRAQLPLILASGRTPWTEKGSDGARDRYIHWAQEMQDQGALVRQHTKWDYELRSAGQIDDLVDRSVAISTSDPMGPTYLSLPREVLAETSDAPVQPFPRQMPVKLGPPDPTAIAATAKRLAVAEFPLIIANGSGRTVEETELLTALAETHAFPVTVFGSSYLALPGDSPAHAGFAPEQLLGQADVILVVNSDVPWIPSLYEPNDTAWIAHLAPDPNFENYPVRGFACHQPLKGSIADGLRALQAALDDIGHAADMLATQRLSDLHEKSRVSIAAARQSGRESGLALPRAEASAILGETIGTDAILINELGAHLPQVDRQKPGTYFQSSPAGGLGWALGAALGMKLARPGELVVCAIGDGSYMFGNPTPAHYVARAHNLPVLFVVFDNGGWGAVDRATQSMYPDGEALKKNIGTFSSFQDPPDYAMVAAASGAHTSTARNPGEARAALEEAVRVVRDDGRQALVRLVCQG